ncbi:hypothetical protein [Nocardia sp. NPDC057227]|uniref:hypothetical protein n=1 Tax=Nocardia sp. NPDC057227 TaxID=3346056 RepID=UPI0036280E42
MSDSVERRLLEARQNAAMKGMKVRRRQSPPYGWELVTADGRVVESGTLTDVEFALLRDQELQ